jgi:two-component sensor histidine kinase
MKELHHRVKNNLQIISSLLSLQSFRIKDEKASRAVREGQQRIEAMSLIHQRLYTRDNITEINIREYISDLVDSLQSAYGFGKDKINIRLDIADELMNVDQAIPLSLIVNELVTNAFKYAFEDNQAPELTVILKRKDGNIVLQVADNGKGVNIEEWTDKEGSFGKELIQTFVKQLNGYLDIAVNKGSQFTLSIPYAT